jgi:hypothetical protein
MKIEIRTDDLLKGQLHQEGWYKGEITRAEEKLSNAKDSTNFTLSLKYSETADGKPVFEREIEDRFNSKAMGFMSPLIAALAGKSLGEFAKEQKEKGKDTVEFEWSAIKGQKVQFRIQSKPRNDNGQLKSEVTDYAPYDMKVPF